MPQTPQTVQSQKNVHFVGIVQNTPSPPSPPPMPTQRVLNYVETVPITPAHVIYQRWSNWANTRLVNFPPPNPEQSEDADLNEPSVNDEVSLMEPVEEAREAPQQKTITAKGIKEKKRKLAFEVPEEEKMKCINGKWRKEHSCERTSEEAKSSWTFILSRSR